jgi:predicted O-methyltransferase YrrM
MRSPKDLIADYIQSLKGDLSPELKKIGEQLVQDKKWGINIGSAEGHILQFLIRSFRVKTILEIGTQYGYSTQWMLEALPVEGSICTLEKDEAHHAMAKSLVRDSRVTFMAGDAVDILQSLDGRKFDLIFIDANKKAYPVYLDWALKHVPSGGLIVGDNTFLFGQVYAEEPDPQKNDLRKAMHQFNQRLLSDPQFFSCLLPTSEGLTIAIKK